ncbi:MAG: S8 family serine peptidase [Thermoanaerobaculia bacterium]
MPPLLLTGVSLLAAAAGHAAQYIVVGDAPRSPAGLERQISRAGGEIVAHLESIGVLVVEGDESFAERTRRLPGVRSVTPDQSVPLVDDFPVAESVSLADSGAEAVPGLSDPLAALQWGLLAVDAPAAWAEGATGRGVRVAVLDSGVDAGHPDLAANVSAALSTSFVPDEGFDDPPGIHGTRVAGVIAAAANELGIVGVAPQAEIVAVKVLSAKTHFGSFGGVLEGIVYAADIGAQIANLSFSVPGGLDPRQPGVGEILLATQRAITYAHDRGVTILAAAGNEGRDVDGKSSFPYPAGLAHVVAVSATAPIGWGATPSVFLDHPSSYSSAGLSLLSVAAPGGDFLYPGRETCSGLPCWILDLVFSTTPGGWGWSAGTSMAVPHAAGVAALLLDAAGGSLTPEEVEAALRRGADDLGELGPDARYGHGRVNAARSLSPPR